jgi:hypothetical protein
VIDQLCQWRDAGTRIVLHRRAGNNTLELRQVGTALTLTLPFCECTQ